MAESFDPAPLRPAQRNLWSMPVDITLWPAGRRWAQILCGFFLTLVMGVGVLASPHGAMTAIFGAFFGLVFAALVNGTLVSWTGRRLSFLSVLLYVVLIPLVTAPVLPPLNAWARALIFASQDDELSLRSLIGELNEIPASDFRYSPARSATVGALRDRYQSTLDKLSGPPAEPAAMEPVLRDGFRMLVESLAGQPEPTVYVVLSEKVDPTVPPEAKVDLRRFAKDADLRPVDGKVPSTEPSDLFPNRSIGMREHHVAAALRRQFTPLIDRNLVTFEALDNKAPDRRPLLKLHADIRHSGRYVKITPQHGFGATLYAEPIVAWTVQFHPARGVPSAPVRYAVTMPPNFAIQRGVREADEFQSLAGVEAPILIMYLKFAWETARKVGLDAGPAPVRFP
jgi:hypothetical protein